MTVKLRAVPYAVTCRCGVMLPKNATARWDKADRLWYDCHLCRPRPAKRSSDQPREGLFRDHNCWSCDHGRLPCKKGSVVDCDNLIARND